MNCCKGLDKLPNFIIFFHEMAIETIFFAYMEKESTNKINNAVALRLYVNMVGVRGVVDSKWIIAVSSHKKVRSMKL